ncbi:hypothetical protein D6E03_09375 [Moraxella catarrhalis]|nr:hypothetical protein D6E03_09375 [Moraxella catarrhalis]
MVLNEAKGYHLAIELDGLTKIQSGYNTLDYVRYQDMWVRQNDSFSNLYCLYYQANPLGVIA